MTCPNCKNPTPVIDINHGLRCAGCGWIDDAARRAAARMLASETQLAGVKLPQIISCSFLAGAMSEAEIHAAMVGAGWNPGWSPGPPDPLDAVIDGMRLGWLVKVDQSARQETNAMVRHALTPAQRAAVSAHWSAELRARVEATAKPKLMVMVQVDDD